MWDPPSQRLAGLIASQQESKNRMSEFTRVEVHRRRLSLKPWLARLVRWPRQTRFQVPFGRGGRPLPHVRPCAEFPRARAHTYDVPASTSCFAARPSGLCTQRVVVGLIRHGVITAPWSMRCVPPAARHGVNAVKRHHRRRTAGHARAGVRGCASTRQAPGGLRPRMRLMEIAARYRQAGWHVVITSGRADLSCGTSSSACPPPWWWTTWAPPRCEQTGGRTGVRKLFLVHARARMCGAR